jgi:activator of HSP90 ATPase
MKRESLTASAVIPGEPGAIYRAWMSSKGHTVMTGSRATVTARVGGKYTAWDGYISGTTRELEPGARIVQSWRTTDFASEAPDSRLEVTFTAVREGTRVTVKHSGLPPGSSAEYRRGWIDFYFKPMKAYFTSSGR